MDNFDSCMNLARLPSPGNYRAAACRLLFDLILFRRLSKRLTLVCGYSAVAGLSVHVLPGVMSKSNDAEKENFLAQVDWLPLTSRSQTYGQL